MVSWIILLVKQYIDIINYLVIGNAIFKLNFNKHKKLKEVKILSLIILLLYIVMYEQIEDIWIDLNVLVCLVSLVIIFRDGLLKTIKIVVISILISTLLEQFIGSFISYDIYNVCSFQFLFSNSLRFIFIMFMSQIISFIFNKTNLLTDLPGYVYINIIFGFSATMFPLFIVQTYKLAIKSRLVIVITAIAYINIIISLVSIFIFIKNSKEKEQYYLDNLLKDKTLKLQEDYYKKLIDNYSDLRKFKHDIKGHLAIINKLINTRNYEKANSYIGNMTEMIESKDVYKSNNIYISTILNSFDQTFKDNDIKFDLSYYITSNLEIDSMDICSLFYNLLMNSIEANLKLKDNRFINLYIASIKNNIVIKIVNPIDKEFDINSIRYAKTTKKDKENHGFGLITINNIISKYNGAVDYTLANKALIIDIILLNVLEN